MGKKLTEQEEEDLVKFVITTIIIIVVLAWWYWPSGKKPKKTTPPPPKTPFELQKENVRAIAMTFVEGHLRAPTTADFFSGTPPYAKYIPDDGTWAVVGTVDSQNGFGAMVRTKYAIVLKPDPGCNDYQSPGCWEITAGPDFAQ